MKTRNANIKNYTLSNIALSTLVMLLGLFWAISLTTLQPGDSLPLEEFVEGLHLPTVNDLPNFGLENPTENWMGKDRPQ